MKKIHLLSLFFILFTNRINAQMGCFTPSLGVYDTGTSPFSAMTATIPCDYLDIIAIRPTAFFSGNNSCAPCLQLKLNPTNINSQTNNSLTISEGATILARVCNSVPVPCFTFVPNSSNYSLSIGALDPTLSHGYNLCNIATAAAIPYTVSSCFSTVPLTTGSWANTPAGNCQTVSIPAGSPIGLANYTVSPAVVSTASTNTGSGYLFLDTYQMSAGVYTITYGFNSQVACSIVATRTILITNPFNPSWTPTTALCANAGCVNPGTITGTAGGTFTASAGMSGSTFCPSLVGAGTWPVTYTVGITPQCGSSQNQNIIVNALPVANAGPTKSITCANTQTVLNGSGGPSYTWSGPGIVTGGATANPTVALSGTYSLNVTSGGCTSLTSTVQVGVNTNTPPATASSTGSITCVNNSISLNAGPASMSYTWTAPGGCAVSPTNSAAATGTGACTYTVRVMDPANGCFTTVAVTPASNMTVAAASAVTSGVINCTNTAFNLSSTPSGAMSYSWIAPGGGSITGGNTLQNTTGSGSGTYSVIVRDVVTGCPTTATCAPAVNTSTSFGTAAASTGTITCASPTVNLSVTGTGINTYTWIAPAGGSVSPPNSATPIGTGAGTYSVVVTGTNGCVAGAAAITTPASNLTPYSGGITSSTGTITCITNTINLSAGGAGATSYTWIAPAGCSVSNANISNPTGTGYGTYSVIIAGTNGCPSSTAFTVTPLRNIAPFSGGIASSTGTITCSSFTFNLNASGAGATSYTWVAPAGGSVSNANISNPIGTGFGTYSVFIAGSNGCPSTSAFTVIPQQTNAGPTGFTASSTGAVSCNSFTTSLNVTGSGIATYTWTAPGGCSVSNPNIANPTATGYCTFSVAVTGTNGCVSSGIATVTPSQNTTTPTGYTVTSTGSITCGTNTVQLNVGGPGVISYTWLPPSGCGTCAVSNANISNPIGTGLGNYSVTVAGSNGCSTTVPATITPSTNFTIPSVSATANSSITCSSTTFSLSGSPVSGGTYTWTAPGTSSVSSPNSSNTNATGPGTYTLSFINSANGCRGTATIAAPFSTLAPVSVSATSSGTVMCNSPSVNLGITAGPYTYSWMPPAGCGTCSVGNPTVSSTTGSGAGTYSVVVTGTNGCPTTATVSPATNLTAPTITAIPIPSITCANTTTIITANPSTGVSYNWSGSGIIGSTSLQTVSVALVSNYTLVVTSLANGCPTTTIATVGSNMIAPSAIGGGSVTVTCANPNATLTGAANPSTCTPSWTWAAGSNTTCVTSTNNFSLTTCGTGTYYLSVTNPANGCPSAPATYTVGSNTPIPQATVANTGTITCTTTTAAIILTTTISPVSYTWSGPGITSGVNQSSITVNMGGAYTYTLLDGMTGCSITPVVNVAVDNTPISITTAASNTISCNTTTAALSATPSPVGSFTYSWSGPTSFTSTAASPTVTAGGVYTVVSTNTVNGCVGTQTVMVNTDLNSPTGVAINPPTFTLSCFTPTTALTATAVGASTYSWIAPATGAIISGGTSATAGINGPGNYSVIVTGTNGCSAAAAIAAISPNTLAPTFVLSNSTPSITCLTANPTVSVNITSSVGIGSYSWTPASGISGSATGSVVTFTTAGTFTGVITATNGCQSNAIVTVASATDAPTFVAGTGTASPLSCANPTTIISPAYTPTTDITFVWSGPGIVGSTTGSSVAVNQNGTYSVTVTNTLTGCASNSLTVIVVGTTIPPSLNVTSSSSVGLGCLPTNSTNILTANATPTNVTYNWSTSATTPTISVNTPGTYTVVITDPATSCTTAVTFTVDNNTTAPTATSVANSIMPCGAMTATLNGGSPDPGVTFSWTGPSIISGSNTSTPVVDQPGTYILTATNPTTGCTSTNTVTLINGVPTASFSPDITSGFAPQTVNFTNLSSASATVFTWSFGDGNSSSATSPSNTYSVAGTYTVMMIASSGLCSDTAYAYIIIEDGFSIEIPNVFTPNGDNVNDVFTIKSTGVKEIQLQIFNRWGQLMYDFTGAKAAWDGITNNGEKATDGTYFYFIIATGFDATKEPVKKNGSLGVFR